MMNNIKKLKEIELNNIHELDQFDRINMKISKSPIICGLTYICDYLMEDSALFNLYTNDDNELVLGDINYMDDITDEDIVYLLRCSITLNEKHESFVLNK